MRLYVGIFPSTHSDLVECKNCEADIRKRVADFLKPKQLFQLFESFEVIVKVYN